MGPIIKEPVKKVTLIVDDVTFIFDNPRILLPMPSGICMARDISFYETDLRIATFDPPTVFRTIEKDGVKEYERLA